MAVSAAVQPKVLHVLSAVCSRLGNLQPLVPSLKPVQQLDCTLCEIAERFGAARREWVMMELEYAGGSSACAPSS